MRALYTVALPKLYIKGEGVMEQVQILNPCDAPLLSHTALSFLFFVFLLKFFKSLVGLSPGLALTSKRGFEALQLSLLMFCKALRRLSSHMRPNSRDTPPTSKL